MVHGSMVALAAGVPHQRSRVAMCRGVVWPAPEVGAIKLWQVPCASACAAAVVRPYVQQPWACVWWTQW
jgi:hypothetical protein